MKVLLVSVVIIGIAAVIGAVVVGMYSFDGTVVENPYEAGIAWDEIRKAREEAGWRIEVLDAPLIQGRNHLRISLRGRDGSPLPDAEVSVKAGRPSTAAHDVRYPLRPEGEGLYSADISLDLFGYWDLAFDVKHRGRTVSLETRIFAGRAASR